MMFQAWPFLSAISLVLKRRIADSRHPIPNKFPFPDELSRDHGNSLSVCVPVIWSGHVSSGIPSR